MLQAEFASLTPRRVLLCTVGECKAGTTARLPPDGLCDLLFYTALHLRPLTNGSQAITAHKTNWRPFRREAAAAKRTRYGVSFPLRNIEQMTRYLASKKSRRQIQSLFKAHIEHFGVLNFTVDSEDYAHDKKIVKRLFQLLSKLQRQWPPRVKATSDGRQRALGLRFRSYADDSELARHTEVMKDLCRSIDITIFVALTHTHTATIWSSWPYKGERINAATLKSTAQNLQAADIGENITVLTTYTLSSGMYIYDKNTTEEDYVLAANCGRKVSFAEHCKQDYVRELTAPGKIRIASYKNYSVSFEDSEIMKQKAADFFEIYRHEKQGWALFDVDFDDFNNTCGEGAFHRISEFKSFLAQVEPIVQV
ncbi:uncharacterized protein LOC142813839 [Rhipicephalus microplus]|uniref:uncharacterized protein LOC142813839 n=1 Tax=Rhipicephalus microplus TaxID=6941 RepID=UPI003F6BC9AA